MNDTSRISIKKPWIIPLRDFEDYYLNIRNFRVYSIKSTQSFPIKNLEEGGKVYYFLYKQGAKRRVSLFELLIMNMDKIQDVVTSVTFPVQTPDTY